MGKLTMRIVDKGWDKLVELLKEVDKEPPTVKAGLLAGKGADTAHDGGLTNVELGIIHEFGAPAAGIPARPWVSAGFAKNQAKYQSHLKTGLTKIYEGKMTPKRLLGLIGAEMAADIKNYVTAGSGVPPPLKPATIAAKGSDRPLIDTGRMVGAISWAIDTDRGE